MWTSNELTQRKTILRREGLIIMILVICIGSMLFVIIPSLDHFTQEQQLQQQSVVQDNNVLKKLQQGFNRNPPVINIQPLTIFPNDRSKDNDIQSTITSPPAVSKIKINSTLNEQIPWRPATRAMLQALQEKFKPDQAWNLSLEQANAFVKEDEAFRKRLGVEDNKWRDSGGSRDVSRLIITMLTREWVKSQDESFRIPIFLEINGPNPEGIYLRNIAEKTVEYNYRESTGENDLLDMSKLQVRNASMVLVPQTLEHVQDVHLAIRQIAQHTAIGGYVICHLPFINRPHGNPHHFSHWTAIGIASVFQTNGFDVRVLKTWGSDAYTRMVLIERRWPSYNVYAQMADGTLNSERNRYGQIFLVARKV